MPMNSADVREYMKGPADPTLIRPRQEVIDVDQFIDSFQQVTPPRGALPIDWRLFSAEKHKDFKTFAERLPLVAHEEKVRMWNLLLDCLQNRSIEKAREFIAACETNGVRALGEGSNKIFWSGAWGKETATGEMNLKHAGEMGAIRDSSGHALFSGEDVDHLAASASDKPFYSLEGGSLGKLLDGLLWDLDWSITVMLWGVISRMFAASAVGDAVLLVTDGMVVGTVFWNDELPTLRLMQRQGIVNKIYIKYKSSRDGTESPLIDIDADPSAVPVLGRRDQRDERYNPQTREWEQTGRTTPDWKILSRPTNLGTIKKAITLLVEMLPQCEFGPNRPLPRFEDKVGVLCRLEKDRQVVRMSQLRHGDHFVVRTWMPNGHATKTILVRPYRRETEGPMRGPTAYKVEQRLTELRGMLEAVDNHLCHSYADWRGMPARMEFDGDTLIADGRIVARKQMGLAYWAPVSQPTPADPFWEQKYLRHVLSPRTV